MIFMGAQAMAAAETHANALERVKQLEQQAYTSQGNFAVIRGRDALLVRSEKGEKVLVDYKQGRAFLFRQTEGQDALVDSFSFSAELKVSMHAFQYNNIGFEAPKRPSSVMLVDFKSFAEKYFTAQLKLQEPRRRELDLHAKFLAAKFAAEHNGPLPPVRGDYGLSGVVNETAAKAGSLYRRNLPPQELARLSLAVLGAEADPNVLSGKQQKIVHEYLDAYSNCGFDMLWEHVEKLRAVGLKVAEITPTELLVSNLNAGVRISDDSEHGRLVEGLIQCGAVERRGSKLVVKSAAKGDAWIYKNYRLNEEPETGVSVQGGKTMVNFSEDESFDTIRMMFSKVLTANKSFENYDVVVVKPAYDQKAFMDGMTWHNERGADLLPANMRNREVLARSAVVLVQSYYSTTATLLEKKGIDPKQFSEEELAFMTYRSFNSGPAWINKAFEEASKKARETGESAEKAFASLLREHYMKPPARYTSARQLQVAGGINVYRYLYPAPAVPLTERPML